MVCNAVRDFTPRLNHLQEYQIWCFHHTTGIEQNVPILQQLCEVSLQSCDTVAKCPISQLILCHHITPKDDCFTTLYTPWTTRPPAIARNSYMHAHIHPGMLTVPNSEQKFYHFKTSMEGAKVMNVSPLCHRVAYSW